MKKILSVIFAVIMIAGAFLMPAYAEDGSETPAEEINEETAEEISGKSPYSSCYMLKADDEAAGKTLLMVCYPDRDVFASFTDNLSIEIVLEKDGETEKKKYGKDDIEFYGEESAYPRGSCELEDILAAYIITDFIDINLNDETSGNLYAVTAEGSLTDSEGNVNTEFRTSDSYYASFSKSRNTGYYSNNIYEYLLPLSMDNIYEGNKIAFSTEFPCDFYVNGSLKDENSLWFNHTFDSTDLTTISIKKFGLELKAEETEPKEITSEEKLDWLKRGFESGPAMMNEVTVASFIPLIGIIAGPFYFLITLMLNAENMIVAIDILFR